MSANNKTGYLHVTQTGDSRFRAAIQMTSKCKQQTLGMYDTAVEAAVAVARRLQAQGQQEEEQQEQGLTCKSRKKEWQRHLEAGGELAAAAAPRLRASQAKGTGAAAYAESAASAAAATPQQPQQSQQLQQLQAAEDNAAASSVVTLGGVRTRARHASSATPELAVITVTEPMVARAAADVAAQREVVALIECTQQRTLGLLNSNTQDWNSDSLSAVEALRGQFASYSHQLSAAQRAAARRTTIEETMRESLALDQLARDRREVVAQRRQAMFDAEQALERALLEAQEAEASVQQGEAGLQRHLANMVNSETLALGN